jgi:hypothetical protein
MIPQLVTAGYRRPGGRWLRLHVPVLPVALLLSPLLPLVTAAGMAACLAFRISPLRALLGTGRLLWSLPGTRLELEQGGTAVLVSVR